MHANLQAGRRRKAGAQRGCSAGRAFPNAGELDVDLCPLIQNRLIETGLRGHVQHLAKEGQSAFVDTQIDRGEMDTDSQGEVMVVCLVSLALEILRDRNRIL